MYTTTVQVLKTEDVIAALGTWNKGEPAVATDLFLGKDNFWGQSLGDLNIDLNEAKK